MAKRFDVIVVGVGAMGSAACLHLARRGVRVVGLEQFDIGHARVSSHGFSRMIRMAYFEHPDYVPLLRRAFWLWRDLEQQSGEKLLHVTGGLYMGRRTDEAVRGSLASAKLHDLPHQLLDRAELAYRYPQFQVSDDHVAMLEANAGLLIPEKCIEAHVELARRRGAEIHSNEPVMSWSSDEKGATVTTTHETYSAEKIVFCSGAWTDKLVRDLGVPLVVTRQVMGWVQPKKPELFQLGSFPVWAIGHADGSLHYGFPILPDGEGFKLAYHAPGAPAGPDNIDRAPRPDDEQTFRPLLSKMIPAADGKLLSMRICMYTNSPDHHFIIDRHPHHPRVLLGCGFSGHGFKFASVIGETLADLATAGRANLPVEFLGLNRFIPRASRGDGAGDRARRQ